MWKTENKGHESLGHCNAIPSLRRRVIFKYIVKYINFKSKLSRFFKYFNIDIFYINDSL